MTPLRAVVVFIVALIVDVCYAKYNRRCAQGRAASAASWSVLIAGFGAFNVITYMGDRVYLIPMLAGYWVGTYWAVKHDAR